MIVAIDVTSEDAVIFTDLLNADEGFRECGVVMLLKQNKGPGIAKWTAFTAVLGALSRAFTTALEQNNVIDLAARRRELRTMAEANDGDVKRAA